MRLKTKMKVTLGVITSLLATIGSSLAAGVGDVIKPFTNLETLLISGCSAIGGVWLIVAVVNFAIANSNNDASSKASALKNIFSAAIMLAIGGVIALLKS